MTRRELFDRIHFVMVKVSYYLLNQEVTLCTDHSLLRWLDSFLDKATDVLARWVHYLEPFRPYITILYRPGKLHGKVTHYRELTQDLALVRIALTMAISLKRLTPLLRGNLGSMQSKLEVRMVIVTWILIWFFR